MKKFLTLLIAILIFACCMVGCTEQEKPEKPEESYEKPPASTVVPPIQNGGNYDGGEYN